MEQHKQRQREHFDTIASTLPEHAPLRDNVMALHQLTYNRKIRRLPLRNGDRVLELRCEYAQLIRVLEGEADFQGVGIDLSFRMVATAHRDRGRMSFLVADAEALPFASSSFDSLMAISLLEHLPHQKQALQEMQRVLRPGGHLLMQFPVRDDLLSWQFFYRLLFPGRFSRVLERLAHDPTLVPLTTQFKSLLLQTGFVLLWQSRDEVFFQPIYDYYVLSLLDRFKRRKDSIQRRIRSSQQIDKNLPRSTRPTFLPRARWRPRPAGIHRVLLPLASILLIPDYLLNKCGIGASLWVLARKK